MLTLRPNTLAVIACVFYRSILYPDREAKLLLQDIARFSIAWVFPFPSSEFLDPAGISIIRNSVYIQEFVALLMFLRSNYLSTKKTCQHKPFTDFTILILELS